MVGTMEYLNWRTGNESGKSCNPVIIVSDLSQISLASDPNHFHRAIKVGQPQNITDL